MTVSSEMERRKEPGLFTVVETAEKLGVSQSTIWRMLRRGELESVQRSGRRLVPRRALERRARASDRSRSRPLSSDHPLWKLVGAFRSGGEGAGSSDKYGVLFGD